MKIIKTVCDRCGTEITGIPFWIQVGPDEGDDDGTYEGKDFCPDCIEKMHAFMLPVTIRREAPEKPKAIVKRRVGRPAKEEKE